MLNILRFLQVCMELDHITTLLDLADELIQGKTFIVILPLDFLTHVEHTNQQEVIQGWWSQRMYFLNVWWLYIVTLDDPLVFSLSVNSTYVVQTFHSKCTCLCLYPINQGSSTHSRLYLFEVVRGLSQLFSDIYSKWIKFKVVWMKYNKQQLLNYT